MSRRESSDSGRKRKKQKGRAIAGVLFTAAMMLCCAVLYMLSRGEIKTAETAENAAQAAQPTAEPERVYPSETVFFERAKQYGLDAECTASAEYAPDKGYLLSREGLEQQAVLVLSMRSLGVCGFTLECPAAAKPNDLPEDPSPVQLSLYEQRLARYELESAWQEKSLPALISGIDILGEVTYGDKTDMLSLMREAAKNGKSDELKGDYGRFSVTVREGTEGNVICASFALKD